MEELINPRRILKTRWEAKTFNVIEPGVYYVAGLGEEQGKPAGAYNFGLLLVLVCGDFFVHLYFPDGEDKGFYFRSSYGKERFRAWQYISSLGNNLTNML